MAQDGRDDRRHEISWPLRWFVGRAGDAELFEPAAEGIGVQPEDLGRASWAVDDPIRLAEHGEDMVALDRFEGRGSRSLRRSVGSGGGLDVNFEVEGGARREDD